MNPQQELHVHLDPITRRHRLYLPHEPGQPMLEADDTVDFDDFLRWVRKRREEREKHSSKARS